MTELEIIELKYFHVKGFKYIARNENGHVVIFKKKPIRYKRGNGYEHWIIEDNFPIKYHEEYGDVEFDKYKSIKWEDAPRLISEVI